MMHRYSFNSLSIKRERHNIDGAFLATIPYRVDRWQGQDVTERPQGETRELLNTTVQYDMPNTLLDLEHEISANLPWAEDHFQERVSGEPLNPPPSNAWWPFAQQGHAEHVDSEGKFSHTYPERFWPKYAGGRRNSTAGGMNRGVRFFYGDLEDVVQQLKKDPSTRQAYLPVWFPEDTGAVQGQRVPCTLGYHFLIRNRQMHITYYIRSCDYMRHFDDDVYMAVRLAAWMMERFNEDAHKDELLRMGQLTMHIVSFHIFEGDVPMVRTRFEKYNSGEAYNFAGLL